MKKKYSLNVGTPTTGKEGVYHNKSILWISTTNKFEPENTQEIVLLKDGDNDITTFYFTLDFDRPNKVYYRQTQVFFSDGTSDNKKPICLISLNGSSNAYHYSNTILKTPNIRRTNANLDVDGEFHFELDDFIVYSGRGQLTHVSWRLCDEGRVLWERPLDPSNLRKLTLPFKLEPRKSYTFEAAVHSGDTMSNYGKYHFVTNDENKTIYDIDFMRYEEGDFGVINNSVFNHFKIDTRRMDYESLDWDIRNSSNLVVLSKSSIPIEETPLDSKSFFISGKHLTVDDYYTLIMKVKFKTIIITREFKLVVREGYNNAHHRTKAYSSDLILNTEETVESNTLTTLIDDKVTFYIRDKTLRKMVRTGAEYIETDIQVSPTFPNQKTTYETRCDVIDDKLIVQMVEEYQVGTEVNTEKVMYIYNYDRINREIFNVSTGIRLKISDVINSMEGLEIAHIGFNMIGTMSTSDGNYNFNTIDLMRGGLAQGADDNFIIGSTLDLGIGKTPTLSALNMEYILFVGTNSSLLYSNRLNMLIPITHIDTEKINFKRWSNIIRKSNGEVYLIGLNDNIEGEELITFFKFNVETMLFELVRTAPIPVEDGVRYLTKPNLSRTLNNFIGLLYPIKTIWLG